MASPRFPEPPPAVPPTPLAEVDAAVARLKAKKDAWVAVPVARRIELLQACVPKLKAAAGRWAEAGARAKGLDPNSSVAGQEWLGGPMTTLRNVRLLIEALQAGGQPRPPKVFQRPDGQTVAEVFPGSLVDKLTFAGFRAEVWIEPGQPATQGQIYREKAAGKAGHGKVSLVLGAGNVSSIGAMDALYKLFVDDEVCIVKTNPVNAYVGPFYVEAFQPLVDEGVLAVVHGGAEVGIHLCNHPDVDTIHITGSDRTHDAIVWGADPAEAARRKAAGEPINTRPISSELGCVTPVMIVPGEWSDDDLEFQARHVASMVENNGSFNCNAGKILVTAKGWPQRDAFLSRVHAALARTPPRKAYYPGAQERYKAFLAQYPQHQVVGQTGPDIVPWTVIPDVPAKQGEYALTNEAFCGVLAEVSLDASDAASFLPMATRFANEDCWGSLSCCMLIHPKTAKAEAAALDRAIADLRFGGVGINAWPGLIYGLVCTTWGAYPGHPLTDIRSGRGVVHNTYLFDHPQKSVVYTPFRIAPTPAWFSDHKNLHKLGEKLIDLESTGSLLQVPGVALAALKG